MVRPTQAIVDLDAFGRNIARLVELAAPAKVCAVTKAAGYGHGSVPCSAAAIEAGATWIAVALVEEGVELRKAGIQAPILVLSEPRPAEMPEVVEASLVPTIYTAAGLDAVERAANLRSTSVAVHLNVDTGMNRVGLRPQQPLAQVTDPAYAVDFVRSIRERPGVRLGGLWTHFAVADEPERPETKEQLDIFRRILDALGPQLGDDVVVHAANSAGLLAFPQAHYDMVRVGISTYGIEPAPGMARDLGLEPAMSLTTEVALVKPVFAGESVSYGLRHTFEHDTMVATIPIGYADGLRRDAYDRGLAVLVGGRRRPIVGVVTMDQAMVDVGPNTTVVPGDEVVLIGRQGDETITVAEIAERLDTIPYEVVCDIGRRVRRTHVRSQG